MADPSTDAPGVTRISVQAQENVANMIKSRMNHIDAVVVGFTIIIIMVTSTTTR
jgi:hypothetical protein